jgi:multiple sugar transport system ATP-binding protein
MRGWLRTLENGSDAMTKIVLDHVTKVFGTDVVAVDDLSLEIADGEFMVLVGPSGCGKSTVLRLLAGLEEVTAGEISIEGQDVTDLPPKERDVAMVFQTYALYPHMTVSQNIGFGLKIRRFHKDEIGKRVLQTARILGLEHLLHRKPVALSGGQRQRVAMGRAVVRDPKAFLMDEPLSNLDAKLRVQMRAELAKLHERLGTTTVYVTHDQVEAMTLGERVAVLREGVLQQVATPQELYKHPANLFVAAFIGSPPMNLAEATVGHEALAFGGFELPVPEGVDLKRYEDRTIILGIRPSDLEDAAVWRDDSLPTIEATADVTEDLGSEVNILFTVNAPPVATDETLAAAPDEGDQEPPSPLIAERGQSVFCARVDPRTAARPGQRVRLSVDPQRFHFFDPQTGKALRAPQAAVASA